MSTPLRSTRAQGCQTTHTPSRSLPNRALFHPSPAPRPVDESVQASQRGHQLAAGPVLQVVGVAQDDVAVQLLQLRRGQALD
jgi:hypothetical protein